MIVMSALLLVLLLAPLGVAPNPTLTASMHRTLYSGIEFSRTQMYPPSTLIIYMNGTSRIPPDSCFRDIADGGITGPQWLNALVDPSLGLVLQGSRAAVGTFAPGTNSTDGPFGSIVLAQYISGDENFQGEGQYRITLGRNCTGIASPVTLFFDIVQGLRSGLGRAMTFAVLTSAALGALLALLGSPTLLTLNQLFVLTTLSNCGAVSIQDEAYIVVFTVVPFRPRLLPQVGIPFATVVFCLVTTAAIGLVEGLAEAVRWWRSKSTPWVYGTGPVLPFFTVTIFNGLTCGIAFFALQSVADPKTPTVASGVALLAFVLLIVGGLSAWLRVARSKTAVFCLYDSKLREIPVALQADGCWGPNAYRCRWNAVMGDTKSRVYAPLELFLRVVAAGVTGPLPSRGSTCQLQAAALLIVYIVLTILVFTVRPYRSFVLRLMACALMPFITVSALFKLLWLGYMVDDQASWLVDAHMVTGLIFGACGGLFGTVQLFSLTVEYCTSMATEAVHHHQALTENRTRADAQMRSSAADDSAPAARRTLKFGEALIDEMVHELQATHAAAIKKFEQHGEYVVLNENNPPSLAAVLLQDVDVLPQTTRELLQAAREADESQIQARARLLEPLVMRNDDLLVLSDDDDAAKHSHPAPYIQGLGGARTNMALFRRL